MKKYEVQHYTLCQGWINTWHEYDDDNNEIPIVFDTYEDAAEELSQHLHDCDMAYKRCDIESPYHPSEFRIVSND